MSDNVKDMGKERVEQAETKNVDEKEARKEKVRKARKVLRDYAAKQDKNDPVRQAIHDLIGDGSRAGAGRKAGTSAMDEIRRIILEQKKISEFDIFKKFKMGRREMGDVVRGLLKTEDPNERVWIRLDGDNEQYVLVHKGADMPKGWDGYDPNNRRDL